ncbi:MAG TPA: hypothetical protein VKA76_10930, partial [Gammaproteobacteria bacterium]|nr:hypothetical protein [Gammaproteobacteria bacterium]
TVTGAFAGSRTEKGHFYAQDGAASYARRPDQQQKITNGRLPFAKSNPEVVAGFWVDKSLLYTYNSSRATDSNITELDPNPAASGGSGAFVAGNVTPQGDLDKLLAGNVQASYGGNMLVQNGVGAPVNISVNFGHGTWNGAWGTSSVAGGGHLPFKASGTVSGPNIVSNKLSTGVTGKVQGAFFGRNAGALAGTVDVRGTVNGANVHDVGVFLTGKGASPATAALR